MYLYVDKNTVVVLKDILAVLRQRGRRNTKTIIIDKDGNRLFTKRSPKLITQRIEEYGKAR